MDSGSIAALLTLSIEYEPETFTKVCSQSVESQLKATAMNNPFNINHVHRNTRATRTWRFLNCIVSASLLIFGGATLSVAQEVAKGKSIAVKKPIPDRLVVLTFDDSAKTHFTTVRPILLTYGFGATFF